MKRLPWVLALLTLFSSANAQFFRTGEEKGVSWFFRPNGSKMWSFGVDCVDTGSPGKPGNPSYNALALFPNEKAWALDTLSNLKSWGFNSLGGWSDDDTLERYAPNGEMLPYFVVLHLGAYDKAPWNDMFDPSCEKALTDAARKLIPPIKDDPYLVGYFTDNELGWWDDTLFMAYMAMGRQSPGKRELVQMLRSRYGSVADLRKDWETSAERFEDLLDETKIYLRPGSHGMETVHAWNHALATRYYSLVREIVREFDTKHMILGDRYQQYYNLETAEAIAPYVDAVSSNLGADYTDGSYSHFYLDSLHAITKKPIIITEYYFAARENSTGNHNHNEYFPTVQTQTERAAGFKACTTYFASLPYVIGAHWFQFTDEPPLGRGDGEDYDMGLVDIHGRPYENMVEAARDARPENVHSRSLAAKSSVEALVQSGAACGAKGGAGDAEHQAATRISLDVPDAPSEAMKGLKNWDRKRGFVQPSTPEKWADLYCCKDKDFCYIGLLDMEFMDESLYKSGHIPTEDRPLLELRVGDWKGSVRFNGKGLKAACSDPRVQVYEKGDLKWTLILKVPLSVAGSHAWDHLSGDLYSHGRGFQMSW